MADFYVKQNDTSPPITAVLEDDNGPVNLEGATEVRFHMRNRAHTVMVVNAVAEIVDAPNALVRYRWTADDTVNRGVYHGEWQATFGNGTIQTFPNVGYTTIEIGAQLG